MKKKKVSLATKVSKATRKENGNALEVLGNALGKVPTLPMKGGMFKKDKMITVRVSTHVKEEIDRTASILGVTVSDYLMMLHKCARPHLGTRAPTD